MICSKHHLSFWSLPVPDCCFHGHIKIQVIEDDDEDDNPNEDEQFPSSVSTENADFSLYIASNQQDEPTQFNDGIIWCWYVICSFRPRLRWRRGYQSSSTATLQRASCRWPTGSSASSTTRWPSWPGTAWPSPAKASSPLSTSASCRRTWRSCYTMWVW